MFKGKNKSLFHLQGFKLLDLENSTNPYYTEYPQARSFYGNIRSDDAFDAIGFDCTRGVSISGKVNVDSEAAIADFRSFIGSNDVEAEKVARAYSQALVGQITSPLWSLENVQKLEQETAFINFFKDSSNQIYYVACLHNFRITSSDNGSEKSLNLPGEVLYIFSYDHKDEKFHLKYPLASNDLLKELYEKNVKIGNKMVLQPHLKQAEVATNKREEIEKISISSLMPKVEAALNSTKNEELKKDIRQMQEANANYEKEISKLQNDIQNYEKRIKTLQASKSKNSSIENILSQKASNARQIIKDNIQVIEDNRKLLKVKSNELTQLEMSDSYNSQSKDKVSSNLLLKTLSNLGHALSVVGRLIFCFAFGLKTSEKDINQILKSESTQGEKTLKNKGCFSFMDHFFNKNKLNIPEPTYMSNLPN